jgi:hypothetical protein
LPNWTAAGDHISFVCDRDAALTVVKRVTRYHSFEEMLDGRRTRHRDRTLAPRDPAVNTNIECWRASIRGCGVDAETHQLVQELATLTGETQTRAVTIAVRERLDRMRHLHEAGLAAPGYRPDDLVRR